MTYRLSDDFIVRHILDETVLVPLGTLVDKYGGFIALNDSGRFCFDLLCEGQDSDALPGLLCAEYDVSPEQAKADADGFIRGFTEMGVLIEEPNINKS